MVEPERLEAREDPDDIDQRIQPPELVQLHLFDRHAMDLGLDPGEALEDRHRGAAEGVVDAAFGQETVEGGIGA